MASAGLSVLPLNQGRPFYSPDNEQQKRQDRLDLFGEAAVHIPDDIFLKHPEVPWYEMRGMRNFVDHEYCQANDSIIWDTLQEDKAYRDTWGRGLDSYLQMMYERLTVILVIRRTAKLMYS
jgi:hypothetical protein